MYEKVRYCMHAKERKRDKSLWIRCVCDIKDRSGIVVYFNDFLKNKNNDDNTSNAGLMKIHTSIAKK